MDDAYSYRRFIQEAHMALGCGLGLRLWACREEGDMVSARRELMVYSRREMRKKKLK